MGTSTVIFMLVIVALFFYVKGKVDAEREYNRQEWLRKSLVERFKVKYGYHPDMFSITPEELQKHFGDHRVNDLFPK